MPELLKNAACGWVYADLVGGGVEMEWEKGEGAVFWGNDKRFKEALSEDKIWDFEWGIKGGGV